MTGPAVVVVDPYSSGVMLAPELRKARYTAVAVRALPLPGEHLVHSYCPEDFDLCLPPSSDVPALMERLRPLDPVAVIPGSASGVVLADLLAAQLTPGRVNVLELSEARCHKGRMVAAVAAAGLPVPSTICTRHFERVRTWQEQTGLHEADLVVKPALSAGTDGVSLAASGQGWERAMAELQGRINLLGLVNDEIVVQERLYGVEYFVDTFSFDGRHTVNAICRYHKINRVGQFAVYESIEFLPYVAPGNAALVGYVTGVLDALGVRFGAAHTEVMLTGDGPRLIELNPRLSGGGLPWTTQVATGENSVDRLIAYLGGRRDIPDRFDLRKHVVVLFFPAPRAGVASNVAVFEQIRELPSFCRMEIGIRDGDVVAAGGDLVNTLRIGWAILAHPDNSQVQADLAAARQIAAGLRVTASDEGLR